MATWWGTGFSKRPTLYRAAYEKNSTWGKVTITAAFGAAATAYAVSGATPATTTTSGSPGITYSVSGVVAASTTGSGSPGGLVPSPGGLVAASSSVTGGGIPITNRAALAALDTALINGQAVKVVCAGDSITEGTGAPTFTTTWPALLQARLRARYRPGQTGGAGYIPTTGTTGGALPVLPLTRTGGSTVMGWLGMGGRTAVVTQAGDSIEYAPQVCDRIRVHWGKGDFVAGNLRIMVDGAAVGTVLSAATPASDGWVIDYPLTRGSHVVRFEAVNPGWQAFPEGVTFYDGDSAAPIHVYNAAHYGLDIAGFATANMTAGHWAAVAAVAPTVTIINLGTNDRFGNAAQSLTALDQVISKTTGPVLLLVPWRPGDITTPGQLSNWQTLTDGIRARATGRVAVWDLAAAWDTSSQTLMLDLLHPSPTGHQRIAELLETALTTPTTTTLVRTAPVSGAAVGSAALNGSPLALVGVSGLPVTATTTLAGSAHEIELAAGIVNASSGITGAPSLLASASGEVGSVSGASGSTQATHPVNGLIAAESGASGEAELDANASGVVAIGCQVTGAAGIRIDGSGSLAASTAVAGSVSTATPTSGSLSASTTVSGAVRVERPASGQVALTSTVSGSVNIVRSVEGQAASTTTVTGTAHAALPAVGLVSGVTDVTGAIGIDYPPPRLTGAHLAPRTVSASVRTTRTGAALKPRATAALAPRTDAHLTEPTRAAIRRET